MWKDGAPGSVGVALGLAEDVVPGSVEVAPGSTEDVALGSEKDARLNPGLNSVEVSVGDLLSTDCQWPTTKPVEDVHLIGGEMRGG